MFEKSSNLVQIVDRSNILEKCFLLILDVVFFVPSQHSFCCIVSLFASAQKSISQIFKIIAQTEDINTFVHRGIISVLHFQIQIVFLVKKTPMVEFETYFCRAAVQI